MGDSRYFVPALARGLEILTSFSEEQPSLRLIDLARRLKLGRSSVYRLVYTLTDLGYLDFDEQTKRYSPSARVLTLAANTAAGMALSTAALPHLKALARRFNETASLGTLVGQHVIFLQRIESQQILTTRFQIGSRIPVYCTSLGKTLLAHLPPHRARTILDALELAPMGPNTITDVDVLLKELDQIRAQGYAINDEELTAGLHSAAAPVKSARGEIVAAVDLSALVARITRDQLVEEIAPAVMQTADHISAALKSVQANEV